MKNTRREILERLVPFNRGELQFLKNCVDRMDDRLRKDDSLREVLPLTSRVNEKLWRALNPPRPPRKRKGGAA